MFEFVNPIAVIGTSCFMAAVATIWYSPYLFQSTWLQAVGLTEAELVSSSRRSVPFLLLTFLSYLVVVYLLALTIGYAQLFGVSVQKVSLLVSLGLASFIGGFVIWEQRSLSYWLITAGFCTVFICGSIFFLYQWPW